MISFFLSLFSLFTLGGPGDKIVGHYEYSNSNAMVGYSIILNVDSTYYYQGGNDLLIFKSSGKWKVSGDTLLLSSKHKMEGSDVVVRDSAYKSDSVLFIFEDKLPYDTKLVLLIAKDVNDSAYCFHVLDDRYMRVYMKDRLKSFELVLGNTIHTKEYVVSSKNSNVFCIHMDAKDVFDNYQYFNDQRFVYENDGIFWLDEKGKRKVVASGLTTYEYLKMKKNK